MRKARQLVRIFSPARGERASAAELEAFRFEHPKLIRDPWEYLQRGQIFLTVEPDDPAPSYLCAALGATAAGICGFAVDYGHWDATLSGCVELVADRPGMDPDFARRLLSGNALDFYGPRLAQAIQRWGLAQTA
jgi:hypothetical protein